MSLNPVATEFAGRAVPEQSKQSASMALDSLTSEVAELRARLAQLTTSLFASKVLVQLHHPEAEGRVGILRLRLDGGIVWEASRQSTFDVPQVVYEHAIAPGEHTLGLEVEHRPSADSRFASWQSSRFTVIVPEAKSLHARFVMDAESDIAERTLEKGEAAAQLSVRLQVEVQ